jgi:dUTP pyrophosphatase
MQLRVTRLDPDLPLPRQQHTDDAGFDLHARESVTLPPAGGRALVPTGLAIAIPPGCAGFVLPRSGLALQHGVTCLNTPGLIDPQYRGELKVLLVNTDRSEAYTVSRGDRIAQLVVQKVEAVEWLEVDELEATSRDAFGFGSTGGFGDGTQT